MTDPATIASVMAVYREIEAELTAPGAPYEMTEIDVRGEPVRTYIHAPTSLYGVFEELRIGHDDDLLITDGVERRTYAEVFDDAERLAAVLHADFRVRAGDRVGIAMANRPADLLALLAVLRAGAVAVLYNARGTVDELHDAIDDVPADVILVDGRREDVVARAAPTSRLISTDAHRDGVDLLDEVVARPAPPIDPPLGTGDDIALILFTSGTSGRAKGVRLTHRGMGNVVLNMRFVADTNLAFASRTYGIDVADLRAYLPTINALLIFPLFHVSGLAALAATMGSGGAVVTMDRWDADRAADLIAEFSVGMVAGPPMVVSDLMSVDDADERLATLVNIVPGGQATPPSVTARVDATLPNTRRSAGWGMTEVGGSVCTAGGDILAVAEGTAGPMSPTMDVRVVDDDGADLPAGAVGELLLRGGLLMDGYHGRPDDTASSFDRGWLRTGDTGYVDEHGLVYLVDRKKDLVIRKGENVSCVEVEAALYGCDQVSEAAVFGVPDDRLGERLIAAVVPADGASPTPGEVLAFASAALSPVKTPDEVIVRTDPLPRNATGKLLKRVLRAEYTA